MKKLLAILAVVTLSSLQAAPEPTVSLTAGGTEKVVQNTTTHQVIDVATLAPFVTLQEAVPTARIIPVVLSEVRPLAATKVVLHRATGIFNLKPAWLAVSKDPVLWKVAHKNPTATVGFSVTSQPTARISPDNPALAAFVQNTPSAWHMPADYDPATKIAQVPDLI